MTLQNNISESHLSMYLSLIPTELINIMFYHIAQHVSFLYSHEHKETQTVSQNLHRNAVP
jgi:hypothetical protein